MYTQIQTQIQVYKQPGERWLAAKDEGGRLRGCYEGPHSPYDWQSGDGDDKSDDHCDDDKGDDHYDDDGDNKAAFLHHMTSDMGLIIFGNMNWTENVNNAIRRCKFMLRSLKNVKGEKDWVYYTNT